MTTLSNFKITATLNGKVTHTLPAASSAEASAVKKGLEAALSIDHIISIQREELVTKMDEAEALTVNAPDGLFSRVLQLRAEYNEAARIQRECNSGLNEIGQTLTSLLKGSDIVATKRGGEFRYRVSSVANPSDDDGMVVFTFRATPFTQKGTVSQTAGTDYFEAMIVEDGTIQPYQEGVKKKHGGTPAQWKIVKLGA